MSSNDTKIVNGWDSQTHIIPFVVKGHNLQNSEIHFITDQSLKGIVPSGTWEKN